MTNWSISQLDVKPNEGDPSQAVMLGVIAQELEQVSPGLVEEHADKDVDGNDLGTTIKVEVAALKAGA